jgi:hypothetical protein
LKKRTTLSGASPTRGLGLIFPQTFHVWLLSTGVSRRPGKAGLRVIYYWATAEHIIYLLAIYAKSEKADLTETELGVLRHILESD